MRLKKFFSPTVAENSHRLAIVDGVRVLAAMAMILCHMGLFASPFLTNSQYLGVVNHPLFKIASTFGVALDIFFVISGFLIGYGLMTLLKEKGQVNLLGFFARRCLRVYPIYLLILLLAFPLCYPNRSHIWMNLLQINNYLPLRDQYAPWTWFLAVDFQFYAVFSVLIWLISKQWIGKKIVIALCISSIVLPFVATHLLINMHHFYHVTHHMYLIGTSEFTEYSSIGFGQLYLRSGSLTYGVLTAYILVYHKTAFLNRITAIKSHNLNFILVAPVGFMIVLMANHQIWFMELSHPVWQTSTYWTMIIRNNLFALCFSLILLLSQAPKGFMLNSLSKFLNFSLFKPLAKLTLITYLIHPIIIAMNNYIFFHSHDNPTAPMYFQTGIWVVLACFLIALPLYFFIEQPPIEYLKRKMQQRKTSEKQSTSLGDYANLDRISSMITQEKASL